MVKKQYSISPAGEKFLIPGQNQYKAELNQLKKIVAVKRGQGKEIVVVVGVGFVGAVMAAVIADATDKKGKPNKFVIGMQRPSTRSYWKIPLLNRGVSPIKSEDPEVGAIIKRCVMEKKTLIATYTYDALKFADVVVIDVQCDYLKESFGDCKTGSANMEALEDSIAIIAERISTNGEPLSRMEIIAATIPTKGPR